MRPVTSGADHESIASVSSETSSETRIPSLPDQGVPVSTVSELRITLDGSERVVAAGTTAGDALEADGRSVIAARVNGELRDLAHEVREGDAVDPVRIGSDDGRAILRHSTAHVMAQAVQELFPEAS